MGKGSPSNVAGTVGVAGIGVLCTFSGVLICTDWLGVGVLGWWLGEGVSGAGLVRSGIGVVLGVLHAVINRIKTTNVDLIFASLVQPLLTSILMQRRIYGIYM